MTTFKEELVATLPELRCFVNTLTKNHADQEDLVQQACWKALVAQKTYDGRRIFPWVCELALNSFFDDLRKIKVRNAKKSEVAAYTTSICCQFNRTPEEVYMEFNGVLDIVAVLPERERTMLIHWSVYGYEKPEIARIFGLPLGTVKTRIFMSLKRLREHRWNYVYHPLLN